MYMLNNVKAMLNEAEAYVKTSNFYYENHICQKNGGENVKVDFNLTLKHGKDGKIINFGICKHCKTIYYHEDYDSKSF